MSTDLVEKLEGKLDKAFGDTVAENERVDVKLQPSPVGEAIVLTDQRVVIIKAGWGTPGGMFGVSTKSFSYDEITSVDLRTSVLGGHLQVSAPGTKEVDNALAAENAVGFSVDYKERMKTVAEMIRRRVGEAKQLHQVSANSTTDQLQQLKTLGELRDAGVLTPEEFEQKKDEILGRSSSEESPNKPRSQEAIEERGHESIHVSEPESQDEHSAQPVAEAESGETNTDTYEKTAASSTENALLRLPKYSANSQRPFWRRIPGFRSGKWWKMILATTAYVSIIIVLVTALTADPSNQELPPYSVVSITDTSFANAKRFTWHVVVEEPATSEQLELIAAEVIDQAKRREAFSALAVAFYDYPEFIGFGHTLGQTFYAPQGDWAKAATVQAGSYGSMRMTHELREKDWSKRLTPGEVSIWSAFYTELYGSPDEDEDVILSRVANALGIDVDEVERVSLKYTIWFMDGAF